MFTDEQNHFLGSDGLVTLKACPGSGKTYVVAEKIRRILSNWKKSHCGVAALSFTNVASEEILQRVNEGRPLGYPHYVGTLDAFLNEYVVLPFGHLFEFRKRPTIDVGYSRNIVVRWRQECHKSCCDNLTQFHYKWDFNSQRLSLVKNSKTIGCVRKIVNGDVIFLPCEDYKNRLWKNGILNQQDVPAITLCLFHVMPEIAKAVVKRFPIVLLDEAQDTSEEQMQVIDKLVENGLKKCYLIGDADQAIYGWRNASSKSFTEKENEPLWNPLILTKNFRSSQLICNAISLFANNQPNIVAEGVYKDCTIKPLLIVYDSSNNDCYDSLKKIFKEKCSNYGIALSNEKVAILTRKNHRKQIDGLWKSLVGNFFADASIEWSLGHRKHAIEKCQKAMFELMFEDSSLMNDSDIFAKRQTVFSDKKWLEMTGKFISMFPSTALPISEWLNNFVSQVDSYLACFGISKNPNCVFTSGKMIKTRDQNFSDFKQWPLKNFYSQMNLDSECFESTVHGVKGCTFDATMLIVESTKGTTLTTSLMTTGPLDNENMRIAYVAMSRPRKFLCVALPKTKNMDLTRFPKEIWDVYRLG